MLSFLRSRVVSFATFLVAVMFVLVCQSRPLGLTFGVLALGALLVGPLAEPERQSEVGASFLCLVLGVLAPRVFALPHPSPAFLSDRTLLAACPALLIAIFRGVLRAPVGGAPPTLAVAVVALAAEGRVHSGFYIPAIVGFVLLGIVGIAMSDPGRAWPKDAGLNHFAKIALALGMTGAIGVGISTGLPRLHDAIVERITERLQERAGFSCTMTLSSLDGMLMSDEVVLRVRHGSPALLRGAVFSRYWQGHWEDSTDGRVATSTIDEVPTHPPDGGGYVELEFPHRPERYFLPPDASDMRASMGQVLTNVDGIRMPYNELYSKRVWYTPGVPPPSHGPLVDDLAVEPPLRDALAAKAEAWGRGADDEARLLSIQKHLNTDYEYSLHFDRTPNVDPLVDFLETHRSGQCEYFASAMAILARLNHVPTRVVTGYRVVESSELGDYRIVRERNAHAWVEAWIDGHWKTFDPTPADPMVSAARVSTPFGAALIDLLSTSWEKVDDFLSKRSPFELTLALVGLLGLLLLARWVRGRGAAKVRVAAPIDPALPCFVALEVALAQRGLTRAPHETLAAFAERIALAAKTEAPLSEATSVVHRYAELRYGGRGDEAALTKEIAGLTSRLRGRAA